MSRKVTREASILRALWKYQIWSVKKMQWNSSHLQNVLFSPVSFGLNKEDLTSKNVCWRSFQLSLLVSTQKILALGKLFFCAPKQWIKQNLHCQATCYSRRKERQKKQCFSNQPLLYQAHGLLTVQLLLLFVRLHHTDWAALTSMKKEASCLPSPLLPHSLFLASCLFAASYCGFVA